MQGPKFKFYIKNREGLYYWVDDLDTVQLSNDKTPLKHAPNGWQEIVAGLIYNNKYKGNFKKVTSALKFVIDGKKIVDYIAIYEGTQGYAELIIDIQVPDNFSYTYFFSGTLDYVDTYDYDDTMTTITIKEQTLIDILDAKENVEMEIPLTDDNSEFIHLDGINLHYKTLYSINNGFNDSNADSFYSGTHIVNLIMASNENPYANETRRVKFVDIPAGMRNTKSKFYKADVAGLINIKYDFQVKARWIGSLLPPLFGFGNPPTDCEVKYQVIVLRSDGSVSSSHVIYNTFGRVPLFGPAPYLLGKIHHIQGEINVTVNIGDEVYFVNYSTGSSSAYQELAVFEYQDNLTSEFILDTLQRSPGTIHRFIRPWKLWQELVNKASDGKYSGISPHLFSDINKCLIPGSALRKDDVVSVKTTIAKFLKYAYVVHLGTLSETSGNNGVINYLGDCFINEEVLDIGLVAEFGWKFSKDDLIGNIKGGYENLDLGVDGQINGKDEFNQTNQFTTGQDKVSEEYDIVSPYHASIYAIEKMRVKFGDLKTTDNKNDNDLFVVDAEKGTNVKYYSGIFNGTAPNIIKIPGTLPALANGTKLTIAGAAANNGVFTITNTSYLQVGYTTLTVAEAVASTGSITGTMTYHEDNMMQPRRPAYASLTGVLDPDTVYNTLLSPKHLLLMHAQVICGGVFNSNASQSLDTLKFQTGDKNYSLSVSMDNITFITENKDEKISQLPMPFYLPINFYFTTDYRNDLFLFMDGPNKYKLVTFTIKNGNKLSGFIREVTSNPDNNEKQKWKLLSAVGTNLINIL